MPFLSPKTILRILIVVCLLGWGGSVIAQAQRVAAPPFERVEWLHDLSLLFFFALVAFGLFYVEYQIVQGSMKLNLSLTMGYVQSAGCFLLLICGLWGIYYAQQNGDSRVSAGYQENVLVFIYVFGHLIFLTNLIWSYTQERKSK